MNKKLKRFCSTTVTPEFLPYQDADTGPEVKGIKVEQVDSSYGFTIDLPAMANDHQP